MTNQKKGDQHDTHQILGDSKKKATTTLHQPTEILGDTQMTRQANEILGDTQEVPTIQELRGTTPVVDITKVFDDDGYAAPPSKSSPTDGDLDDMLSTKQVADIMKLTSSTILRKLREGDLPGHKINNGQWRVKKRDLLLHMHIISETPKNLGYNRDVSEIPDDEADAYVTVEQTAQYLDLNIEYVRNLIRQQKIKGFKDSVSGEWRVYVQSIKRYENDTLRFAGRYNTRWYKVRLDPEQFEAMATQFDISPLYPNRANEGTRGTEFTPENDTKQPEFGEKLSDLLPFPDMQKVSNIASKAESWNLDFPDLEEIVAGDRKIYTSPYEVIQTNEPEYNQEALSKILGNMTKDELIQHILEKQKTGDSIVEQVYWNTHGADEEE